MNYTPTSRMTVQYLPVHHISRLVVDAEYPLLRPSSFLLRQYFLSIQMPHRACAVLELYRLCRPFFSRSAGILVGFFEVGRWCRSQLALIFTLRGAHWVSLTWHRQFYSAAGPQMPISIECLMLMHEWHFHLERRLKPCPSTVLQHPKLLDCN
jgi:hypothetical protein